MSVINRIEVANLLNKHGDIASPWDAKMRHLLLDLRGQSSAISMENGFGKTTLAEALIGLLSRDRTLISRTRRKCSPSVVAGQGRSWSHLRVEFRSRSAGERQEDMLAAAGEEVAGETFVFGFYGYSDGSGLSFYHYPGRLEDIAVHHHTADGMLALYANSDIKAAMASHGVRLTHNREEWLDAVGAHISRRELVQLAAFQKEGGADKSQIFNAIKPRGGEKADQAFFFEVLAPEILSGATRGETDESEELIEEVILNSGTHITELRYRLNEAESDQRRTADKVASLATLSADGTALLKARQARERLDAELASLERLLGGQAMAGLPGVPQRADKQEIDSQTLTGFVWAVGDTGRPRVSTWLLARLSGTSERGIRQALSERGARVDTHRRLIHLPEATWLTARDIGHVSFTAARDWLSYTLSFSDDSARHRALEALDYGAEAFEAVDGNRFREEVIADRTYLDEVSYDLAGLEKRIDTLEQDRERLENQQRDFVDNQSFYTQALAEGLFSEAELEAPELAAEACQREAEATRRALNDHLSRIGELKQVAAWHTEFQHRYPGEMPADHLAEKTQREGLITEAMDEAGEQRGPLVERCRQLADEAAMLRDEQQRLTGEQGLLDQGQGPWQAFVAGWPDEEVRGFWTRRKTQLAEREARCRDAERRQQDAQRDQARLAPLAEAARRYVELHGDDEPVHLRTRLRERERELADTRRCLDQREVELHELQQARLDFAECNELAPAAWLQDAQRRYPRLLSEAESLDAAINERQRYLESLSGDPLERREVEAAVERLLSREEIAWRPLHEVLNDPQWAEKKRRDWLVQAAGVLFAPVVEGEANAEDVAGLLVDAGLALPVLESGALAGCLATGQSPLGAVQGVETLAVKAALDPRYLDELREATERRLAADRERQAALAAECRRLDPHGEAYALAVRARQADDAGVTEALASLAEQQAALSEQQAVLAPRLSDVALSCIDDYQRYLQEGGDLALEAAAEVVLEAESELAGQQPIVAEEEQALARHGSTWLAAEQFANAGGIERLEALNTRLDILDQRQAEVGERRHQAEAQHEVLERRLSDLGVELTTLFVDGERERLRTLADFEADGGVAFVATAGEVQKTLEAQQTTANRRAGFDLARIRAYLDVRDASGGSQKLERDIARVKREHAECRQQIKGKRDEHDLVTRRLDEQRRAMEWVDQLAIEWLNVVRDLPEGWVQRLDALNDVNDGINRGAVWPLDDEVHAQRQAALDNWWRLAVEPSALDLATLEGCQQTLLEALNGLNLGEQARNRERQDKSVRTLEQRLAEALEVAAQNRAFSDTERARLATLKGVSAAALADLATLHDQLEAQLTTHRQRVERLHVSREQIEGTLVERLSSIIADAAGNLDILKRVARSHGEGGAYFEVRAALVDGEPLRELIATLLADIDEHQAAQRRRAERDGGVPDGDARHRDEDLLRQIRRRIYRGLFHAVTIRLKHDAIRPHGRLFSLNEDMSEGQREAVSLMWLVKLSEFAIERELRELPGHHKRRARRSRESVILLDGLFSKLSHRRLIQDSLESLRNTRGRFQMIGLIHNPNYENDPAIFPTYLVGSVIGGAQGQGGHVMVRDGRIVEPTTLGRSTGEASLFGVHISESVE